MFKEIYKSCGEVKEEMELPYELGLRTGDTSAKERKKIKTSAPDLLITTPESLHVMLSQKNYSDYFSDLEMIVVDEWHELIGSKRGVLVELALSRLKTVQPNLMIWGISATIGNLEQAQQILLGHHFDKSVLVKADIEKKMVFKTVFPDELEILPWAGHLGLKMAPKVVEIIAQNNTTLIFTNTRGQAEVWYRTLLETEPELAGLIALHHGSLGSDIRNWVEEQLHLGKLKAVVCTSSLDLGVDFRPVDTVVQIGSAKGVARCIQRAGRSGHRPNSTSTLYFIPTHSLEIIEGSAIRQAKENNQLEERLPYIRSFDVLIQYLVTLAVGGGFVEENIYKEVKSTVCFESITHEEWKKCIYFLVEGGETLGAYNEFRKLYKDGDGIYRMINRKQSMRYRMNIGTIVSTGMLNVKFKNGKRIGVMEEWFISRMEVGDGFWYGGQSLIFLGIKDMDAFVKKGTSKKGNIPSFLGGRMPLSTALAKNIQNKIHTYQTQGGVDDELKFLAPLFDYQEAQSCLPKNNELLIEKLNLKDGCHVVVYPFEGRFVHEGMSSIIASRISRIKKISFSIAMNDYGFELLSDQDIPIEEALAQDLFSPNNLSQDILKTVNLPEMAKRKFRDIAVISGLVFNGFPGKNPKAKHLQASAQLFFKVFDEFDNNNLLFKQAFEEVLEFQLEFARLQKAFEIISKQKIRLVKPKQPTPFSFPILVDGIREKFSNEDLLSRITRMQKETEWN